MSRPLIRTRAAFAVVIAAAIAGVCSTPAHATETTSCDETWTRVASPSPGTIYTDLLDVAAVGANDSWSVGFRAYIDDDDLYAVSPIIERWRGGSWTLAYHPDSKGQLAGIFAVNSDDVWAVGHTGLESPDYQPLIMHWDGDAWTKVPTPSVAMAYLTAIGGTDADDLWAAGTLIGTYDLITMHWDGDAWTLVDNPAPSSDYVAVGGLTATASNNVWLVGTYLKNAKNTPLTMEWDGSAWRRRAAVSIGQGTSLLDVTHTGAGRIWAVGNAQRDGKTVAISERLTARGWVLDKGSAINGSAGFASVSGGANGLWAVGSQVVGDGPAATLIERWLPASKRWHTVDSADAAGDSYLLAVDQADDGEMWAVGFHRTDIERTLTERRCA